MEESHRAKQIVVSLDGNIGAGKSTLLEKLRGIQGIHVIDEPVDTWSKFQTADGQNLLQHFYKDTRRWAYTFQNAAILTRMLHIQQTLAKYPDTRLFITERSTLTDKFVFAKMLYQDGLIDDMEMGLYNAWFDTFAGNIPVEFVLWLNTDVKTCQERIRMRGRAGEENISETYLEKLDRGHHEWLMSAEMESKCVKISSEITADEVEKIIHRIVTLHNLKSMKDAEIIINTSQQQPAFCPLQ